MEPFSIACTTCQARLRVRDESVIGQILTCPKCGSMVLIEPPAATADAAQHNEPVQPREPAGEAEFDGIDRNGAGGRDFEGAGSLPNEPAIALSPGSPDLTETVEDLSVQADPRSVSRHDAPEADDRSGWRSDLPDADELNVAAPPDLLPPPRPVSDAVLLPNADWTSASSVQWRNRILTGIAGIAGVILAVLLLVVFGGGENAASTASLSPAPNETGRDAVTETPESVEPVSEVPGDQALEHSADDEPATPVPGNAADDEPSNASSRDVAAERASTPPIKETPEPPVPKAMDSDPERRVAQPVTNDPAADEPPGLTPKVPAGETEVAGGEPSLLSETFREFGALLESAVEPASSMPAVDAESPPAPEAGESEAEPVARRPGPRVVEINDRLNDPVVQIEFNGVPLANFLRFASDYSTIPITLDADILRWARVSPATPITLKASDVTVAEMLSQGLAPLELEYRIEGDQLFITRRPKIESGIRTVSFKVEDLAGDDPQRLQQLGNQIMDFVQPDSWSSRGGIGTITFRGSELVIEQYETVQFEILGFCEKLRVARGLDTRGPYDARMFPLATRRERASANLAQSITLTYIRPAPLQRVVDRIAQASKLHILIDWRALAEAGWSPDAEVRFSVADQPVSQALESLLAPMDLAYRVVDQTTLQLTTPTVVDSRLEVEFYRIPMLDDGGAELVQAARDAIGPANFRDLGGTGQLAFDEPSNCLLACLSQTRQKELQAWLASRGETKVSSASVENTTPTSAVK